MTLLEYLKQLMGRKEPEPAPASVERSEPNEPVATKSSPGWGLLFVLSVVVGAALDDLDHAAINAVDDPVCIVDAAAPIAGQIAAEALGLADALIAVAVDVLQKL